MVWRRPFFYPVIIKLGYDPLWFGMIIAITVMVGVVIPLWRSTSLWSEPSRKQPFSVIYNGVYPFLLSLVFCAFLLFLFPQIATFLPNMLMR